MVYAAARFAALVWLVGGCGGGSGTPAASGGASSGGGESGSGSGSSGAAVGGQLGGGSGTVSSSGGGGGAIAGGGSGSPSGGNASAGAGPIGMAGSAGSSAGAGAGGQGSFTYPEAAGVLEVLERVNQQFADKWPDPGTAIVVSGTSRPSNIWTRAVYYEGLMALYGVAPKPVYLDYATAWGKAHKWQLRDNDSTTTNADNQCTGQTYIDLYNLDGGKDAQRIAAIQTSIDGMVKGSVTDAWTWVDAIQMSMPVFARLGALQPTGGYFDAAYALYQHPKQKLALYNTTDHLWWRDSNWKSQKTPGGKQVYWSRGNGWVFAALARALELWPQSDPHRAELATDFTDMAAALLTRQRSDGFWDPSLADPTHYGGPESSGTALFVYGMAWGIRQGLLDEPSYAPAVLHAWQGLTYVAIQANGFVGYLQSTGDDPSDGQPLSATKVPDYEDYGVGCVLLGGSELVRLATR